MKRDFGCNRTAGIIDQLEIIYVVGLLQGSLPCVFFFADSAKTKYIIENYRCTIERIFLLN